MVLIFKPFQRQEAMIGELVSEHTNSHTSHHGCSSTRTRIFKVGDKEFGGDYAILPFTIKKCLLFKVILTDYALSKYTK